MDKASQEKNGEVREQGLEEEDFEEEEKEEESAPSHLPLAPQSSTELSDLPTTVDPSYIISLIRRLVPNDARVDEADEDPNKNVQDNCKHDVEHKPTEGEQSATTVNGASHETEDKSVNGDKDDVLSDPWEDSGCVLWDLAANKTLAEFMVDNYLLELLVANLQVSTSSRVTEICLGIIGNLACHESLSGKISSTNGLIDAVVDKLYLDDSICLCEAFRLIAASLCSNSFASWVASLLPDQNLLRLLWIVGNTLNSTLLEKSIELLFAIVDSQGTSNILLQPLIKSGLSNVIVSLLECELGKLKDDNKVERSTNLDLILHLVEAVSVSDSYSQAFSSNKELCSLICSIVKLPDKIELASSCASAIVVIANFMADEQYLSLELSQDYSFLDGLLNSLPVISDDPPARNALWCILGGLLKHIQEDSNLSTLNKCASLFLEKSSLVEEDIEGHACGNAEDMQGATADQYSSRPAISLGGILRIMEKWLASLDKDVTGVDDIDSKVNKFMNYCRKHQPQRAHVTT